MLDEGVPALPAFLGHLKSMVASAASCCTPARPSSAVFMPALIMRNAKGESVSILAEPGHGPRQRSSSGTTASTAALKSLLGAN